MLNVVTFSANLCNQLTNKIIEKFNQSKDDFFQRISNKYRQDIYLLETDGKKLISTNVPKYNDGTVKESSNLFDLLDSEDKEEVLTLINLEETYKQQIRELRLFLLPLANKTQTVNDKFEITSYEPVSYLKFLNCLPDFITQDKELLTRNIPNIGRLTEEDLYEVENYLSQLSVSKRTKLKEEISQFVAEHKNDKIDNILASLYSLEFLVDF